MSRSVRPSAFFTIPIVTHPESILQNWLVATTVRPLEETPVEYIYRKRKADRGGGLY